MRFIAKSIVFFAVSSSIFAGIPDSPTRSWLKHIDTFSLNKIAENISPADAEVGAVIAAKTKANPNYYYHWVRDAGLTIDALISVYKTTTDAQQKNLIRKKINEYIGFSAKIQNTNTITGLGEPKFNVDGSPFNEPWARPQNDSPALRSISLIHWAQQLILEGKNAEVKEKLYDTAATLPIKKDLEYVAHHWNDSSYDLWEEVNASHFYTLMVERRALLEGAQLARSLGDEKAATYYLQQGKAIEPVINQFWDNQEHFISATINRVAGLDYKKSNVDVAVILGLLHGGMDDGFFDVSDPRVLATIEKLISVFKDIYPINKRNASLGPAIGRYPEDVYSGAAFTGGNPWPLCTLALAEALYKYGNILYKHNQVKVAEEVYRIADTFVERVRYHANSDGSLNEQIDRNTGYMTSVSDLTWNYAALLTTRNAIL